MNRERRHRERRCCCHQCILVSGPGTVTQTSRLLPPPPPAHPRSVPTFWGTFPSLQGQDGFSWDQKCKGASLEQRQPGREAQSKGGVQWGTGTHRQGRWGKRGTEGEAERITQRDRDIGIGQGQSRGKSLRPQAGLCNILGAQGRKQMEPLAHTCPFPSQHVSCTVRGHMQRSGQLISCIQAALTTSLPPLTTPPCSGHLGLCTRGQGPPGR